MDARRYLGWDDAERTERACIDCVTGMDCSERGEQLATLKLSPGYWRADNITDDIRSCPKEDLCMGGTLEDTCPEFNTGPYVRGVGASERERHALLCQTRAESRLCSLEEEGAAAAAALLRQER
jgi:hypothetical protein